MTVRSGRTIHRGTRCSTTLAERLGTARIVQRLADLQRHVVGLATVQVPITAGRRRGRSYEGIDDEPSAPALSQD